MIPLCPGYPGHECGRPVILIPCENCHELFHPHTGRQRFCMAPECRKMQKARNRKLRKEWFDKAKNNERYQKQYGSLRQQENKKAKRIKCPFCGRSTINRFRCDNCWEKVTAIDPEYVYGGLVE